MLRSFLAVALGLALWWQGPAAFGCLLRPPVEGPVVQGFAPRGMYEGHWGIDIGVPVGTTVRSAGAGRVTFAGKVVDNLTVTIDHGGGVRTSYSYLSELLAVAGSQVEEGEVLGRSGIAHDDEALHFSVRIFDSYVDPVALVGCPAPGGGLRLVP